MHPLDRRIARQSLRLVLLVAHHRRDPQAVTQRMIAAARKTLNRLEAERKGIP
jgi:hypothetical protein